MKKILSAIVMGICLSLLSAATVHANADCQFVLGFQMIRDLIGHSIVGECLENQRYNAIATASSRLPAGSSFGARRTTAPLSPTATTHGSMAQTDFRSVSIINALRGRPPPLHRQQHPRSPARRCATLLTEMSGCSCKTAYLAGVPEVWRLHDLIAFGDLDNDGVEDAAVVLSYNAAAAARSIVYSPSSMKRRAASRCLHGTWRPHSAQFTRNHSRCHYGEDGSARPQ